MKGNKLFRIGWQVQDTWTSTPIDNHALGLALGRHMVSGEDHVMLLAILLTHSDHLCKYSPDWCKKQQVNCIAIGSHPNSSNIDTKLQFHQLLYKNIQI